MRPTQKQYEAKKLKLRAIKNAWGNRLRYLRGPMWREAGEVKVSALEYGELVREYFKAKDRLNNFIHSSLQHHSQRTGRVHMLFL